MELSSETKNIFKALSEFQKEVKQPKKDADNPYFKSKYVPLENVVEVIHEAASKHGLSELNYPAQEDNAVGVGVIITHSSGEYIKFPPVLLKPDKNTPQGIGAAITYARRYALSSAFGIASETDDDGNSISGNEANNTPKQKTEEKVKTATTKQISDIRESLRGYAEATGNTDKASIGKIEAWGLGQLGVDNFKDIPAAKVTSFIEGIEEMIGRVKEQEQNNEQASLFVGSTTQPKQ